MKEIDFDKLQEEFEQALTRFEPPEGPRGLTTLEWADTWGVGKEKARVLIKEYIKTGIMEYIGKAGREAINNEIRFQPVYAPVSSVGNGS